MRREVLNCDVESYPHRFVVRAATCADSCLELLFGEAPGTVMYEWSTDEDDLSMSVRVGTPDRWQIIHPTSKWQSMQTSLTKDEFEEAADLYYVDVNKQ